MKTLLPIKSAEFIVSAVQPRQYPAVVLPEVAFAGRSNVGKSSLINCLVQRKKLVRTSRTPGRTQTINFFKINDAFYFVDLPGYGFAKVPEAVRARWRPMVESYLHQRQSLRGMVLILDVRRPPTPDDLKLWYWLREHRISVLPVLTKADKLPRGKQQLHLQQAAASLGIAEAELLLFSATTRQGREKLLERLGDWLPAE